MKNFYKIDLDSTDKNKGPPDMGEPITLYKIFTLSLNKLFFYYST